MKKGTVRSTPGEGDIKARVAQLTALHKTLLDITAQRDLTKLLQAIVQRAARLLMGTSGGLYLCDAEKQACTCVVSYKTPRDFTGTVLRYGEGAAGKVAASGQPLQIDDYRAWEGHAKVFESEQPFRAVLAAPLLWHGGVTGVIDVLREQPFTQADLELLTMFADQAAIAVENARALEAERAARIQAEKDITERKHFEEQYRIIVRTALDGFWMVDMQGRFLDVNDAYCNLVDYSREELLTMSIPDIEAVEKPEETAARIRKITEVGGDRFETRHRCKDGRSVDIEVSVKYMRGDERMFVFLRDITEREQAEERLRESEARLQSLFETMTEGVILIAPDGQIVQANPAAERILGLERSEITGRNYVAPEWKIIRPAGMPMPPEEMAGPRAMKERQTVKDVVMGVERPDGAITWINVSAAPLINENGELEGVVGTFADITERKRAETALLEAETRYRTLVEQITAVTYIDSVDQASSAIFNSPQVEVLTGYTPEEWIADPELWIRLIHPEDRARVLAEHLRTNETGDPFKIEYRIIARDGRIVWVHDEALLLRDEAGQPQCWQGILLDITERKRAEERIRQLQEYLQLQVDRMPIGLIVWDTEFRVTSWNPASEKIFGFTAEEALGEHPYGLIVPKEAQPPVDDIWGRLLQGDTTAHSINDNMTKDGRAIICQWSNTPLKETDGTVRGVLSMVQDITESKRAEEALRTSEEHLRLVTDNMQDMVVRTDLQGLILYASPSNKIVLGLEPERMLGKSVYDYMHPDDIDRVREFTLASLQAQTTGKQEFRYRHADGHYLWLESAEAIIFDEGGSPAGAVFSTREITERKRAEEKLTASEAELRTLFAAMTDVVIIYDADGRYIKIAPTNPANLYRPPGDMLGKTVHDILPKEQADYIVAKIGEAIQTGQVVTGEYALQIGGKEIWFASSASRLSENTAVWVAHDITNRKQAEEQIQRQVETLGVLYDLSRKLSEIEDFNAILDLVTRGAVESAHVTFARVLLLEQDDLVVRAAFPVRVLDHDLQVGQREPLIAHPLCQRVLEGNAPLVLQLDSPEAGDCASFFLGIAQTLCIVPLHVREQPFGLLMLGEARDPAREPFTADKIRLACSISDQAASTLHRALLHEETVRQLDHLQALHRIDQTIAASMDLRITLSVLLEHVTGQLKVDAASVLLLNPHMQTLEYAAGRGFRTEALQRTHLRLGEGYAGRAALERKLIYLPDLRGRKTDFLRSPYFSAEGFVAYYGVPLIAKGQVKGVLEVFHRAPLASGPDWVSFLETLAGQAAIAIDNTQLFDNLQRSNVDLVLAYDATIEGWSAALDLRDKETEGHSQRVTEMTMQLARSLGIGEAELVHVRRGALLHDMGKMGVSDDILLKPSSLSDEEWVIMKKHPQVAYNMLSPIAYLRPALDIPYCHHEKWDGTGYPRSLKGEEIPLSARIFALVDVYDALTSDRPYRKAWSKAKTLEYIREQSGQHFDPQVVEAFLQMADGR